MLRPLLAIETSGPCARVAVLLPNGAVAASRDKTAERPASSVLALCDEALRAAGVTVADLGAVACGAGPGSFTGLRVGLGVAKGLALPTGMKLVLISSLDALACDLGAPAGTIVVPCIDAGKGEVYSAVGGSPTGPVPPRDVALRARRIAAGAPIVAGGSGVDRYVDVFRAELGPDAVRAGVAGPSAVAVGHLALARLAAGESDDLERAVPIYGRPPDITRPKASR